MKFWKTSSAFTLIEVLIVVAILAIVALVIVPSFLSGNHQADVSGATQQIIASLRLAQSQSAQQVQDIQWGVHFSNATNTAPFYAVFSGPSYASGTVQSVYRLPSDVGFVSSTLPSGSSLDVVFSPISGTVPVSTTIQIYDIAQPSISSTVSIFATGAVMSGMPNVTTQQYLYAVDSGEQEVEKFNLNGTYISEFSIAGYDSPDNMSINANGDFYLNNMAGNDIVEFSPMGNYLSSFGSYGSGNGQFDTPADIAFNANGDIYVADRNHYRIEEFSATGTYMSQFGSYGSGNGQFESPFGVAVDSSGNIYVSDTQNENIQKFNSSGTYVSTIASSGTGNGQVGIPWAIGINPENSEMYVLDANTAGNRVDVFSATSTPISNFGSTGTGTGQFYGFQDGGVAFDTTGNVYVTDSNVPGSRVEKFTSSGTYITQIGSYGTSTGEFDYIRGLGIY